MKGRTTEQLLADAERWLAEDVRAIEGDPYFHGSIANLLEVIRRQQNQIDLLTGRASHGLPLEGTGPLPLERKG